MRRNAITISLPEELNYKVNSYCVETERPRSWLIKKALEAYFADLDDLEIAQTRKLDLNDKELTLKEARRELGLSD